MAHSRFGITKYRSAHRCRGVIVERMFGVVVRQLCHPTNFSSLTIESHIFIFIFIFWLGIPTLFSGSLGYYKPPLFELGIQEVDFFTKWTASSEPEDGMVRVKEMANML